MRQKFLPPLWFGLLAYVLIAFFFALKATPFPTTADQLRKQEVALVIAAPAVTQHAQHLQGQDAWVIIQPGLCTETRPYEIETRSGRFSITVSVCNTTDEELPISRKMVLEVVLHAHQEVLNDSGGAWPSKNPYVVRASGPMTFYITFDRLEGGC